MDSHEDVPRLLKVPILSPRSETVVYVSIGCAVENIASLDQQFPAGLTRYQKDESTLRAKLWLFDPKFWNCLPLCLRSSSALTSPTMDFEGCSSDACPSWKLIGRGLYRQGCLDVEVCPYFFEAKSNFFDPFFLYLKHILFHGGHVYLAIFTQPYLKLEENHDVISLYNLLARFYDMVRIDRNASLNYYHLSEYGSHREDKQTLVWNLKEGDEHNQDEALLLEVSKYPGEFASFGCAAYACYPGKLFPVIKSASGAIDYDAIYKSAQAEVMKRGGPEKCLAENHLLLNSIVFP